MESGSDSERGVWARRSLDPPRKLGSSRLMRKEEEKFAKAATIARRRAVCNTVLREMNGIVGFWVLTWASVVVLGGFVTQLHRREFLWASGLLLLQAVQFTFTNRIWVVGITRLSHMLFVSEGSRITGQPLGSLYLDASARLLSFYVPPLCFVISSGVSIRELRMLKGFHAYNVYHIALIVFYALIFLNACIAYCRLLLSGVVNYPLFLGQGRSLFLHCFHNRVIKHAILLGTAASLTDLSQIELLDFVYDMMADECRHFIDKRALFSLCKDAIPYVYAHARGFEVTMTALDSNDHYVQEAALLMLGFLVHLESSSTQESRRLHFQEALLSRVVDLGLGSSVDGPRKKAALWSLHMLAEHNPRALTHGVRVPLLQDLTQRVAMLIDLGGHKSDMDDHELLPLFNTLIALCQDLSSHACFTPQQVCLLSDKLQMVEQYTSTSNQLSTSQRRLQEAALGVRLALDSLSSTSVQQSASMAALPPHLPESLEDEDTQLAHGASTFSRLLHTFTTWIFLSLFLVFCGLLSYLIPKLDPIHSSKQ